MQDTAISPSESPIVTDEGNANEDIVEASANNTGNSTRAINTFSSLEYKAFSDISKAALQREKVVTDFIKNTNWHLEDKNQTMHVIFPPSTHLVPAAWKEVQKTAQVISIKNS